jgi:hypothetical protein
VNIEREKFPIHFHFHGFQSRPLPLEDVISLCGGLETFSERKSFFLRMYVFRQSFRLISSSLKKTSPSPTLRRTMFTAAATIPSPLPKTNRAEIQSKIKSIEFVLESFADYENEEERRFFLRQNFPAIPHLKIYYKLTKEALRTEMRTLRTEENTLLKMEIQLRLLLLPPPPGQ